MTPDVLRSTRFLRLARWWVRRELGRALDGLHVSGLEEAREVCRRHPILFVANHVSWWDPLVVLALDEALETEGYALMDGENLCRIPFFVWLGGIPLDRASPARSRAGLRAAAALLDRPGRAVWIFPQGRHRPAHLRPLAFQPGVRLLARLAPRAGVIPVALQYAYRDAHQPAAYARFAAPLSSAEVAGEEGIERVEQSVRAALEGIDRRLADAAPSLPALIPSRLRRPDRALGSRVLAWGAARRIRRRQGDEQITSHPGSPTSGA